MGRLGSTVLATLLVLAASASMARAESKNISPAYESCMDKSGGVTVEMHDCMNAEHALQDKRLNAAYKAALKVAEERAGALKEAQRAWLKFRDLNCGFFGGGEGTIAGIIGSSCVLNMTAERADELQGFAESPS